MKTLVSLLTICLVTLQLQANEPAKTDYGKLMVEQLAMRFRFPDRYMDFERGEPAPKDMAFYEMVRRGLIRVGTVKAEVEFLLGASEFPGEKGAAEKDTSELNFGMMGGGLFIVLDKDGTVIRALLHHDGDPESAHTDSIQLKPKDTGKGAGGKPPEAPSSPP